MITNTPSTRHHTLQVTDTHTSVSSVPVFTSRFVATDFNTGTVAVSLNLSLIKFYVHRCTLTPNTFFHRLPYRSKLSTDNCVGRPTCFQDNSSERTTQKSQSLYCCRGVHLSSGVYTIGQSGRSTRDLDT
jgi:hypothetical protein